MCRYRDARFRECKGLSSYAPNNHSSNRNLYIAKLHYKRTIQKTPSCAISNAVSDSSNLKERTIEIITVFKSVSNVFLRDWKRRETKVAEEYCWVITHVAGRSCCCRSGSSALEFGFHLDCKSLHMYSCTYAYSTARCGEFYWRRNIQNITIT